MEFLFVLMWTWNFVTLKMNHKEEKVKKHHIRGSYYWSRIASHKNVCSNVQKNGMKNIYILNKLDLSDKF